jgi:hypothetical protein
MRGMKGGERKNKMVKENIEKEKVEWKR